MCVKGQYLMEEDAYSKLTLKKPQHSDFTLEGYLNRL